MKTPTTAPDLFSKTRTEWVEECRDTARKLLKVRHSITIEDVLRQCPRPRYIRANTTGSVFQHEDFVPVGYTKARKSSSHGRVIRMWGLKNEAV